MQLVKSDREVPSADSKWECSTHRRQMSLGLREANGILDYQKCGPGLGGVSGHEYLLAGERTDRVADRLDGHEEDKLWGQYVGLTFRGRTGIRQTEACLQQMEMLPKVVSYSSTISDCEKGTLWQRALGFAKFLQQMEVPPNAISHSSAISACEKGWPWRQARRPVVCRQQIETLPRSSAADPRLAPVRKAGKGGKRWEFARACSKWKCCTSSPAPVPLSAFVRGSGNGCQHRYL
eukprot:TRINITY_DN11546_c0_g1_i2.p1 TRINITY_DN11546_c0_g1~~TRINITY_DN11546_c0_g1_i2.p1  ORF type:complete len:235 (-),score=15.91 TRINITY_DN11546_c0_g1_i2:379-1083(-)